jgi:hypothetical protein
MKTPQQLTKREYFAALIMQNLCSNIDTQYTNAELAVKQADILIKELNKIQEKI